MKKKHGYFQFFFLMSILLKGIDGLLELVGGIAFVILGKEDVLNLLFRFLSYDAFKIPNETILKIVTEASHGFTNNLKVFISIILIGNGVTKIVLAIALLMKKLYAFIISIWFLIGLLIYQFIELAYKPSIFLGVLTAIDVLVIFVIWHQYVFLKRTHGFK